MVDTFIISCAYKKVWRGESNVEYGGPMRAADRGTKRAPGVAGRGGGEGACPRCGQERLRRYPVNSEGGWFEVVKCQACLLSVKRERWSRLGPIQPLSDSL